MDRAHGCHRHPVQSNIRDQATGAQLVCLSNLENLNALFIAEGLVQSERLTRLNQIAIQQLKLLTADDRTPRMPDNRGPRWIRAIQSLTRRRGENQIANEVSSAIHSYTDLFEGNGTRINSPLKDSHFCIE